MIVDLGDLVTDQFFGEVVLTFQNGKIVLVKKTETFKYLEKGIDLTVAVVLR